MVGRDKLQERKKKKIQAKKGKKSLQYLREAELTELFFS